MTMDPLDSCEHLELIPTETDKQRIQEYIDRLVGDEEDPELNNKFMNFLWGNARDILGRPYIPHCKKKDCVCVVMDSPVMSMQRYGGMYQEIGITIMNTPKIRRCQDREFPENTTDGKEILKEFLLRRAVNPQMYQLPGGCR